jgi:hypothetical protein
MFGWNELRNYLNKNKYPMINPKNPIKNINTKGSHFLDLILLGKKIYRTVVNKKAAKP